jgi:UDP-N-acetylglucosamine--N-acetylmuramyl-(pentapeptide) pyrophosphoryl-undecaprenol N-acetylglucosamine transferase
MKKTGDRRQEIGDRIQESGVRNKNNDILLSLFVFPSSFILYPSSFYSLPTVHCPLEIMPTAPLHIVFAGGGTGGHLFPGLAVAEKLAQQMPGARITFAGSGKAFERRQVGRAGWEYLALPCRPAPRRAREAFLFVIEHYAGYWAASRFLAREHVAAVVGLGGYASVPMGRAVARQGVPLILLEQNAVAGRATRWLARRAAAICLALQSARKDLSTRCPVHVTGNPIRGGFHPALSADRQLLILGGSSGAQSLNENVPLALHEIRDRLAGWRIVHQTGEAGLSATHGLYRKLGLEAIVTDFIGDMPGMLSTSTLAVCRAGGTTLAELAAAGLPAVLLPYPHAANAHQRRNADAYREAGAAFVLDERELPGRLDLRLADMLSWLLADRGQRAKMASAMRGLSRPDAAREIAELVRSIAFRQRNRGTGKAA